MFFLLPSVPEILITTSSNVNSSTKTSLNCSVMSALSQVLCVYFVDIFYQIIYINVVPISPEECKLLSVGALHVIFFFNPAQHVMGQLGCTVFRMPGPHAS